MKDKKLEKKLLNLIYSVKSIDEENLIVRGIVGSDDSLDRHGDRVNPKGWVLDNYKKNPVILLNHDNHDLPIGKAINVRRNKNQLLFDVQFSKTYDKARTVFNLVKEGIMNAVSVGFIVLEWGEAGSEYTINKQELLELSFVTVPANPNALTNDQKEMLASFVKSLDENETVEEPKEDEKGDEVVDTPETNETDENEATDELKDDGGNVNNDVENEKEDKLLEISNRLDELEKKFNELEKSIDARITNYFESLEVKADEPEEDPKLEALLALRQELKETNQGSGKALKGLNQLLKELKEE